MRERLVIAAVCIMNETLFAICSSSRLTGPQHSNVCGRKVIKPEPSGHRKLRNGIPAIVVGFKIGVMKGVDVSPTQPNTICELGCCMARNDAGGFPRQNIVHRRWRSSRAPMWPAGCSPTDPRRVK